MDESTFVSLTYIYMLLVNDKYDKSVLSDFKKHVFTVFKRSNDITDFRFNFLSGSLCMDEKLYRLRRNFIKFISENNRLLGYKF